MPSCDVSLVLKGYTCDPSSYSPSKVDLLFISYVSLLNRLQPLPSGGGYVHYWRSLVFSKAHSVRGAKTTAAANSKVPLSEILRMADWSTPFDFPAILLQTRSQLNICSCGYSLALFVAVCSTFVVCAELKICNLLLLTFALLPYKHCHFGVSLFWVALKYYQLYLIVCLLLAPLFFALNSTCCFLIYFERSLCNIIIIIPRPRSGLPV